MFERELYFDKDWLYMYQEHESSQHVYLSDVIH